MESVRDNETEIRVLEYLMACNARDDDDLKLAMMAIDKDCFGNLDFREIYICIKELYDNNHDVGVDRVLNNLPHDLYGLIMDRFARDLYKNNASIELDLKRLNEYKSIRNKQEIMKKTLNDLSINTTLSTDKKLEMMDSSAISILNSSISDSGYKFIAEFSDDVFKDEEELKVSTGMPSLDELLDGGLREGTLTVFGALPSTGKTLMGATIITNMLKVNHKKKGLFFSAELKCSDMAKKFHMAFSQSNFPSITSQSSMDYWDMIKDRIAICDTKIKDISQIEREIRRFCASNDCNPVVIDYLGMLTNNSRSKDAKYLQLKDLTQRLSSLGAELNINIILLSQLSREVDKRDDPRPRMTDSADTTGSYDNAAYWIGLFRHDEHTAPDTIELWLRKNRYGDNNKMCILNFKDGMVSEMSQIEKLHHHEFKKEKELKTKKPF